MKRSFLLVLLITVSSLSLWARQVEPNKMSDIKEGEGLFQQHCFVCHGTVTRGGGKRYGPRLSKENMVSEGFVRKQITDGGERMPEFKYTLEPSQINLIIGYLKTVEPPQPH